MPIELVADFLCFTVLLLLRNVHMFDARTNDIDTTSCLEPEEDGMIKISSNANRISICMSLFLF